MGGGTRLLVPIKSYLHRRGAGGAAASPLGSRRHVNLIASPSRIGLYVQPLRRNKTVRWHETIRLRVKPTTSNLRPLERLSRRQLKEGDCDPVTSALLQWDQQWRLYLARYYSEEMELVSNLSPEDFAEIEGCRRLLDLYSRDANNRILTLQQQTNAVQQELSTGARTPSGLSATEVNVFRLSRRERVHQSVVRTLVDLMLAWTAVEKWRWPEINAKAQAAAHADGASAEMIRLGSGIVLELPLVSTVSGRQNLFLDFVDRIEAFQRKYKSVGDGVKRLRKKVVRGWKTPNSISLGAATPVSYGEATPHPSAFGNAPKEICTSE